MEFENLNDVSSKLFAPILLILGTLGNLFGLLVVSKKEMKKVGPQFIYIALFIFDLINLILFLGSLTLLYFHFVARSQIFLLKTPPRIFFFMFVRLSHA